MKSFSVHFNELAAKIMVFAGYLIGIPFVIVTVAMMFMIDEPGDILSLFIFLAIDLVCAVPVVMGMRMKRQARRFREYSDLIFDERIFSLRGLAEATGRTPETVRHELAAMIDKKYFPEDMRIDNIRREIVLPQFADGVKSAGLNTETVICKNCGSPVVKRINDAGMCEYCGSAVV